MNSVDLTKAYKDEEWESTFQHEIYKVLERLASIEKLFETANKPDNFVISKTLNGLITYLLLTCCDKLGQTSEFIQFNNWLLSTNELHNTPNLTEFIN